MILKNLIYSFYQRKLLAEVKSAKLVPKHVGIIMDGNRRYALKAGLPNFSAGHQRGADKLDELLDWCEQLDIPMITIWVLSTENLARQPQELKPLLNIIENKIKQISQSQQTHQRKMKIRCLGKTELLPNSTRQILTEAEKATASYNSFHLNIAIGYGGRQEITDAVQKLVNEKINQNIDLNNLAKEITSNEIGKHLYTFDLPDPDLIIRTSGETRLSGFLLWQSAYSEFYFCDAYWPAFRKIDFLRAIRSYQQRQRRFGL
jgi:short-chain Z-isoprenyl diphosphate synthase